MAARAIIFHGRGGHPDYCWHRWLAARLEARGYVVEIPHYPGLNRDPLETFLPTVLASHVFDRETVLVGHPAGAALLLAILDEAGDSSIVYLLETNAKRLLFTGDIEEAVARRLAASWRGGPVDVFLATHHGSEKGSVAELLAKIDPACAVVSVGKGHGHPTIGAMQRLHAAGANIWCTARNGSMTATVRRDGIDWARTAPEAAA